MRTERQLRADSFAFLGVVAYLVAWRFLRQAFFTHENWWNSTWFVVGVFGVATLFAAFGQSDRVSAFALLLITGGTFVGLVALGLFG